MRLLVSALALSLLVAVIGCGPTTPAPKGDGGKPPVDPSKDGKPPAEKPKDEKPKDEKKTDAPAFKLTAEEYAKEWKQDEKAAGAKYKDKVVELTGVVQKVFGGDEPQLNFVLPGGSPDVGCFFDDKQVWLQVSRGPKVVLRGKVFRSDLGPNLGFCVLTEKGPNAAITLTTEALAGEYAKDAGATVAKYKDKTLNLTGQIVRKDKEEDAFKVELKGSGKVKVICWFVPALARSAEPLKVGQTITVVDALNPFFQKDNEMRVDGFRVIAKE